MICAKCGATNPDDSSNCGQCGAPVEAAAQGPASTLAIASLVCGILSFILCGCISGIPALIMGKMELNKIDAGTSSRAGRGLAYAGFIMGIINTVLTVLGAVIVALMMALGMGANMFNR